MFPKLLSRIQLNMYTLIIICLMLSTSSFLALTTIKKINNTWPYIMDLHQLRADIATANINLRNAAIAPTEYKRDQLTRMLIPRTSATKIYENLSVASLTQQENKVFNEMKNGRISYRDAQNKVVDSIKANKDIWKSIVEYEIEQVRYQNQVDFLIKSIKDRNEKRYNEIIKGFVITYIFTLLGFVFLVLVKKT